MRVVYGEDSHRARVPDLLPCYLVAVRVPKPLDSNANDLALVVHRRVQALELGAH
jgi:hypothetical protein